MTRRARTPRRSPTRDELRRARRRGGSSRWTPSAYFSRPGPAADRRPRAARAHPAPRARARAAARARGRSRSPRQRPAERSPGAAGCRRCRRSLDCAVASEPATARRRSAAQAMSPSAGMRWRSPQRGSRAPRARRRSGRRCARPRRCPGSVKLMIRLITISPPMPDSASRDLTRAQLDAAAPIRPKIAPEAPTVGDVRRDEQRAERAARAATTT